MRNEERLSRSSNNRRLPGSIGTVALRVAGSRTTYEMELVM